MGTTQAELFKVLGGESRIRIIELLKQKGPLCVNEMSQLLGITPSAVSQHLKILKHAGLVWSERKGFWVPYEVAPAALERCRVLLSKVCTCGCKGSGRIREAQINSAEDKIALLRKCERELRNKLKEVRAQIDEETSKR